MHVPEAREDSVGLTATRVREDKRECLQNWSLKFLTRPILVTSLAKDPTTWVIDRAKRKAGRRNTNTKCFSGPAARYPVHAHHKRNHTPANGAIKHTTRNEQNVLGISSPISDSR